MHITDEMIESAGDKLIAGEPLSQIERRILNSPQADFAMSQVRAVLRAKALADEIADKPVK